MDADKEVVAYLRTLIDHYEDCHVENCVECAIVRGACEYFRGRIFNSVLPTPRAAGTDRPPKALRRLAGLR